MSYSSNQYVVSVTKTAKVDFRYFDMKLILLLVISVVYCSASSLVASENNVLKIEIDPGEGKLSVKQALCISRTIWLNFVQHIHNRFTYNRRSQNRSGYELRLFYNLHDVLNYRSIVELLDELLKHVQQNGEENVQIDHTQYNNIIEHWVQFFDISAEFAERLERFVVLPKDTVTVSIEYGIVNIAVEARERLVRIIAAFSKYDQWVRLIKSKLDLNKHKMELKQHVETLKSWWEKSGDTKVRLADVLCAANTTIGIIDQTHTLIDIVTTNTTADIKIIDVIDFLIYGEAIQFKVRRGQIAIALALKYWESVKLQNYSRYIESDANNVKECMQEIALTLSSSTATPDKMLSLRNLLAHRNIPYKYEDIFDDLFSLLPQAVVESYKADTENAWTIIDSSAFTDNDCLGYRSTLTENGTFFSGVASNIVKIPAENVNLILQMMRKYLTEKCIPIFENATTRQLEDSCVVTLETKLKDFYKTNLMVDLLLFEKYQSDVSNEVYAKVLQAYAQFSEIVEINRQKMDAYMRVLELEGSNSHGLYAIKRIEALLIPIIAQYEATIEARWTNVSTYSIEMIKDHLSACNASLSANIEPLATEIQSTPSTQNTNSATGEGISQINEHNNKNIEPSETFNEIANITISLMSQIDIVLSDKWAKTKVPGILLSILADEFARIAHIIGLIEFCWPDFTDDDHSNISQSLQQSGITKTCKRAKDFEGQSGLVAEYYKLQASETYDPENNWFVYFKELNEIISEFSSLLSDVLKVIPASRFAEGKPSVWYNTFKKFEAQQEKRINAN